MFFKTRRLLAAQSEQQRPDCYTTDGSNYIPPAFKGVADQPTRTQTPATTSPPRTPLTMFFKTRRLRALAAQREQQNYTTKPMLRLPIEVLLCITPHLDELSMVLLSRVCRHFRNHLCAKDTFAKWATRATPLDKMALLGMNERERFYGVMNMDFAGKLGNKAMCILCHGLHDKSVFSEMMLAMPAAERICLGGWGKVRVCEHVEILIDEIKESEKLQENKVILLCGKHPYDEAGLEQRRYLTFETPKCRLSRYTRFNHVPKGYLAKRDKNSRMLFVDTQLPCIPTYIPGREQHDMLIEILKDNQAPICEHLRVCDVMATFGKQSTVTQRAVGKRCHSHNCITHYSFAHTPATTGVINLIVERCLGDGKDPADPFWVGALMENPYPVVQL